VREKLPLGYLFLLQVVLLWDELVAEVEKVLGSHQQDYHQCNISLLFLCLSHKNSRRKLLLDPDFFGLLVQLL
jgi:hypothetical protein